MNSAPTTLLLFAATAITELVRCYVPSLWLRKSGSMSADRAEPCHLYGC
ncbi:membrane protein YnfA [Xanthomonas fragariae]|uniref:Membrane protein YnfA n=1 Tax=Xanthomonas fragariae TaxID=48664 RepID=A0A1Y6HJR1_9XANT|nr:membrane protein YnfA [Xanthomonas fragariae]